MIALCIMCGGLDCEDNPIRFDTWGLPFVSDPFPAHVACMVDYGYDRVTETEMHEALM